MGKALVIVESPAKAKTINKYLGYDVVVKDALLAEALKALTERKRDVILLSYFMEMNDADIARKLNLVRSTVHEHRTRSLEILKAMLEENVNENRRKKCK